MLDDKRYSDPSTAQADRFRDVLRRLTALERSVSSPGVLPIGSLIYTFGDIPSGWLALNGSTFPVSDWQSLAKMRPDWVSGTSLTIPSVSGASGATAIIRGR